MAITTSQDAGSYVQAPDIYKALAPSEFVRNKGVVQPFTQAYEQGTDDFNKEALATQQIAQARNTTQQQSQTLRGLVASTNAKNAADTEQNTKKLDLIDAQHDTDFAQIKADQAKASQARIINENNAARTQQIADNYNKGIPLFTGLTDADKQAAVTQIGTQLQQQALQAQAQQPGVSVANPNSPTGNPIPTPPPPQQGPLSGVGPSTPPQGAPAAPAGFGVGIGPGLPAYPAYRQSPLSGLAPTGSVGQAPANLANAQPSSAQPTAVANGPQNAGATGPSQVGPLSGIRPSIEQALNSTDPEYQAKLAQQQGLASQEQGRSAQEQSRAVLLQVQAEDAKAGRPWRGQPDDWRVAGIADNGNLVTMNSKTGETKTIEGSAINKTMQTAQVKAQEDLLKTADSLKIDPAPFMDGNGNLTNPVGLRQAVAQASQPAKGQQITTVMINGKPMRGTISYTKDANGNQVPSFNAIGQAPPTGGGGFVVAGLNGNTSAAPATGAAPASAPQQGTPAAPVFGKRPDGTFGIISQ